MSKIRPSKGAPYARILGVGGYRPVRVVDERVRLVARHERPVGAVAAVGETFGYEPDAVRCLGAEPGVG